MAFLYAKRHRVERGRQMKWVLRGIGAVVLVALVALGALLLMPSARIARVASEQIAAATGREVTLMGDVSISLWPVVGISADGLRLGNADWSPNGPMLEADAVSIGVEGSALFGGDVRITHLEVEGPVIRLEEAADGRVNWEISEASPGPVAASDSGAPAPAAAPPTFGLDRMNIHDATIIYQPAGGSAIRFDGLSMTLDWPERTGPAEITVTSASFGPEMVLDARIDAFAGFLQGQVQPLLLDLSGAGGKVRLEGRGNLAGDLATRVSADLPDTDAFVTGLGLDPLGLPQTFGASLKLETELTLTADKRLSLRGFNADLGGNALSGDADIDLSDLPRVNARLEAGFLDLDFAPGAAPTGATEAADAEAGSSAAVGTGWSTSPIDASALSGFDGDIALTAGGIDLGSVVLGPTHVLLRNERSRMVFELREVAAYSGQVTGEFVINNRSGLSVGGKLAARGIGLQPLLSDLADVDRLTGRADADLSFLGVGQSVDAIMRSLSGQGGLRTGQGTIEGIDLDALMRSGDDSDGTTVFDNLGATFTMAEGVLRNEDLLLRLSSFEARGAGVVGLGAQDIDYVFTPVALRANDGQGLAIPIRIRGPWSGPKVLPDLEGALDLNLEAEKERIREEAKEKIEAKVTEKLGLDVKEGQSLEDAAKEKIENELKKGLRSLFD